MKMLDKIIEIIKYSKLPTILLITVLLCFSYFFIKGETDLYNPNVIIGFLIGLIALLFAIFSYADYRSREKIDHILQKYETALNHISLTHSKYEKEQRNTIAKSGESVGSSRKGGGYNVEDNDFGSTADDIGSA